MLTRSKQIARNLRYIKKQRSLLQSCGELNKDKIFSSLYFFPGGG